MNLTEFHNRLRMPFEDREIHFRPGATSGSRGLALAYIDARTVMKRLDEVCGPFGWQTDFIASADGKRLICKLSILLPAQDDLFGGQEKWIHRSDGAGATDVEGEKGAFSDALKRAAVQFGIGRYLYQFPDTWHEMDGKRFKEKPPIPKNFTKAFFIENVMEAESAARNTANGD